MRFAQKLACVIVLVLAAAFSAGGSVLLYGNFADALQNAAQQNEAQHALACYSLESNMLARHSRGDAVDDEFLKQHMSGTHSAVGKHAAYSAVYRNQAAPETQAVFSNLPAGLENSVEGLPDNQMRYVKIDSRVFALYQTPMIEATGLVSAFDVSEIYAVRTRSVQRFLWLEAAVLACAAVAAVLLSHWLTKPLATLTAASADIAGGAYEKRTCIRTADEIGALSGSFDAMAESVEQTVHALEASVQQRDDFMGAFTHELKTPMTAIIGYADTLRTMQCDPDAQKMAAGYIFGEAKRVETLSQKLLQLLVLSEQHIVLCPVSLFTVLRRVEYASKPWWGKVTVSFAPCAADLLVRADADLLTDLLYNLLHNAVKACDAAGAVTVAHTQTQEGICITVGDNGHGIPAHLLERVTEPFFMVDKSRARRSGGSGIGLALCNKIAALHGTQLSIKSGEHKGTVVSFALQLADKALAPHAAQSDKTSVALAAPRKSAHPEAATPIATEEVRKDNEQ